MYFFEIHVTPTKKPVLDHDDAGAFVNCFIVSDSRDNALHTSINLIKENNWEFDQIEDEAIVTQENYQNDEEGGKYFQQALVDGEVLVFYTYPLVDEDEE